MAANDDDGRQVRATVTSLGNTDSDEEPMTGDRMGPAGVADDQDPMAGDRMAPAGFVNDEEFADEEDLDEGYTGDPDAVIVDDGAEAGQAESADGAIPEPRHAAGPIPEAARPGMAGGDHVPAGPQQLHDQWAAIQSSFVDDPRASVAAAAELVNEAIRAMIATAQEREQGLRSEWDRAGTDTEALRNALRGYRSLLDQMVVP